MRTIVSVIDQIVAVLPTAPAASIADQMTTLQAELRLQRRQGMYVAPEANSYAFDRLGQTLYRYMPQPHSFPFVQQVSDIISATVGLGT